jgi:hypothetical protein
MIDLDDRLRSELYELVPFDTRGDWREIVVRSGLARERSQQRWAISLGALVAAALLVAATPLGAGIARGLDDFSSWLTGEPGTPLRRSSGNSTGRMLDRGSGSRRGPSFGIWPRRRRRTRPSTSLASVPARARFAFASR